MPPTTASQPPPDWSQERPQYTGAPLPYPSLNLFPALSPDHLVSFPFSLRLESGMRKDSVIAKSV